MRLQLQPCNVLSAGLSAIRLLEPEWPMSASPVIGRNPEAAGSILRVRVESRVRMDRSSLPSYKPFNHSQFAGPNGTIPSQSFAVVAAHGKARVISSSI